MTVSPRDGYVACAALHGSRVSYRDLGLKSREYGYRLFAAVVVHEGIGAGSARAVISGPGAPGQHVVPTLAVHPIFVSRTAAQRIVALATGELVGSRPSCQLVGFGAAVDGVIAVPAIQLVGA